MGWGIGDGYIGLISRFINVVVMWGCVRRDVVRCFICDNSVFVADVKQKEFVLGKHHKTKKQQCRPFVVLLEADEER